jgi:hypothetical protein
MPTATKMLTKRSKERMISTLKTEVFGVEIDAGREIARQEPVE